MDFKDKENTQDIGSGVESSLDFKDRDLSPKDKLQFAKWVLRGIFIVLIISIGIWLYQQSCGEILLEIFRTGLLPIASFVIGDYFGSRGR